MTKPFVGRLDPPHYDYYLGDGVYATFDGCNVWLDLRASSEGGDVFPRNQAGRLGIALDEDTMTKLKAYHDEARDQYRPQ